MSLQEIDEVIWRCKKSREMQGGVSKKMFIELAESLKKTVSRMSLNPQEGRLGGSRVSQKSVSSSVFDEQKRLLSLEQRLRRQIENNKRQFETRTIDTGRILSQLQRNSTTAWNEIEGLKMNSNVVKNEIEGLKKEVGELESTKSQREGLISSNRNVDQSKSARKQKEGLISRDRKVDKLKMREVIEGKKVGEEGRDKIMGGIKMFKGVVGQEKGREKTLKTLRKERREGRVQMRIGENRNTSITRNGGNLRDLNGGLSTKASENMTVKDQGNLVANESEVRMIQSEITSSKNLPEKQGFFKSICSTLFWRKKLFKNQTYSPSQWCQIKTECNYKITSLNSVISAKKNFTIAFWPEIIQSGFSKEISFRKLSDFGVSFGVGEAKISNGQILGVDGANAFEYHSNGDVIKRMQRVRTQGCGYKKDDKIKIILGSKTIQWSCNGQQGFLFEYQMDLRKKLVFFVKMSTVGDSFYCCK